MIRCPLPRPPVISRNNSAILNLVRLKYILIALALFLLPLGPAFAVDITVSGTCTLVNAMAAAQLDSVWASCPAGDGADTIILNSDVTLSADLGSVSTEITIRGNGNTVSGDDEGRVFLVTDGGRLTINNLTISNGRIADPGGAIQVRGHRGADIE